MAKKNTREVGVDGGAILASRDLLRQKENNDMTFVYSEIAAGLRNPDLNKMKSKGENYEEEEEIEYDEERED